MGFMTSEPVMFLYGVVFMINYTVLPQLLLHKLCLQHNGNNFTVCNERNHTIEEQKSASVWWFYLLTSSLLPSTITVLIWGPLTDNIGRKKSLLLVAIVDTLRTSVNLVNSYFATSHPAFLLLASFLPSLHGDVQGVITVCYAYVADVTRDQTETRTLRMGILEGSMFVAGVVAGLTSGYTLQMLGFVALFAAVLVVDLLMMVYVCCLPSVRYNRRFDPVAIPDEHHNRQLADCSAEENAQAVNTKLPNSTTPLNQTQAASGSSKSRLFGYISKPFAVVMDADDNMSSGVVVPMLCAFGIAIVAIVGERVVQTLYLRNQPFFFTPKMIGYYISLQAGIRGVGAVVFTQLLYRVFKVNDFCMVIVGLISHILVLVLTGLSTAVLTVYLVSIVGVCVPLPMAAIRSIITKSVPHDKYGTVLASVSAVDAFASFITNTVSLWMYDLTLSMYSGSVYFGICTFALISLTIVATTYIKQIIEMSRAGYQSI